MFRRGISSAAAHLFLVLTSAATAHAGPPSSPAPEEGAAPDAYSRPAPYVLPFGLRGIIPATAVRAETADGIDAGTSNTLVQYLTGAYAVVPELSLFARWGWVDFSPDGKSASNAFTNATLGGLWGAKLGETLKVAATVGTGLPVAQGGGDTPNAGEAAAIAAGTIARSRFEGSTTFSPNDLAPFLGGDLAWVSGGLTLQVEASLFEAIRVRGSEADPDAAKTSLTMGAHVGYFLVPQLSVGAEIREQIFLSTPSAVAAGKSSRGWATLGVGPRLHIKLGPTVWIRPGLAFIQPLNDTAPGSPAGSYHILQLDVPVTF
jgi:hypothetical protein